MAKYVKTEQGYQGIETTVVPVVNQEIVTTVPPMVGEKMDKNNPVGTGSFSMGRKPGSVIGASSHAEGLSTTASGSYSHAEGSGTIASGSYSHAEGHMTTASGDRSHAEGYTTTASGIYSHAEGVSTIASGESSHAEGWSTTAGSQYQHVQGRYNVVDSQHKYANIVGNGTSASARSNAHTLDWNGVPWFKGRPQFGGTAQNQGSQTVMANGDKEIILASTTTDSTKKFKITVDDDYNVSATNTSDSVSKTLATTEYVDSSVSKSNPLNITGASVGQIAKITAVDDSGKPTAWEAVDMPSGGGGSGWREVIDYTVDAEMSALTITTDKNGLPFNLREAVLFIEAVGNAETETFRFVVSTDQAVDVSWGSGTELFVVPGLASKMERQYYLARFIALGSATLPVTAMKTSTSNYVDNFMPDRVSNGESCGFNGKNAGNYTKIDQLKFVSYARILNAGARVRLWGVDA